MDEQPPEPERGPLYGSLRWMQPGCLMWILITAVCFSMVWIVPLFTGQGNDTGVIGGIVVLAAGVGILWLIMTITEYLAGTSDERPGPGDAGSLDRGAGTMSWYDSDDGGGSE